VKTEIFGGACDFSCKYTQGTSTVCGRGWGESDGTNYRTDISPHLPLPPSLWRLEFRKENSNKKGFSLLGSVSAKGNAGNKWIYPTIYSKSEKNLRR